MISPKAHSAVRRSGAAVFVALALLGAACGGDDKKEVAADQTTTSVTEASTTSTEATTTTIAAETTTSAAAKVTTTTKKATTTTAKPTTTTSSTTTTIPVITSDITVLAAASLSEAFTEIGKSFEAANPNMKVKFSFDSSSTLATQANNGAPADLFASADETNMKKVTDAGNASDPKIFIRNRLAIIVQKGNPKGITKLADFNNAGVKFVICALQVPCGNYAKQAMDKAGVTATPASYAQNVKGVVTAVTNGEADAGIVYLSDARAASANSDSVDIPDEHNVIALYPIAILKQSKHVDAARVWIDYLLTPQGQSVMAKYGFMPL